MEMDDRRLREIQANTIFTMSASGRILSRNDPEQGPGPRLYIAGSKAGNVFRVGAEVEEDVASSIARLMAGEPPLIEPGGRPVHFEQYRRLLGSEGGAGEDFGLTWALPNTTGYQHPATLVRSGTPEGDALTAGIRGQGMPLALVALGFVDLSHFWEPWCVAMDGGGVAAIAFAARLGREAAEAGVAAVLASRGRGFAAAAAAGWAAHPALAGKPLFYTTSPANTSSQRVTGRLGLRFIGASLAIF